MSNCVPPDSSVLGSAVDDVPAVLAQLEGDVVGLESGNSVSLIFLFVRRQKPDPAFVWVPVSGLQRLIL